jgi:hypothetical protein
MNLDMNMLMLLINKCGLKFGIKKINKIFNIKPGLPGSVNTCRGMCGMFSGTQKNFAECAECFSVLKKIKLVWRNVRNVFRCLKMDFNGIYTMVYTILLYSIATSIYLRNDLRIFRQHSAKMDADKIRVYGMCGMCGMFFPPLRMRAYAHAHARARN